MLIFCRLAFAMPTVKKKIAAKGRRRPVQGRSQATVEALLAAAAQILARHGPDAATTNAIAARAGVSIGSLYQYFGDREALIDALAERHIAQMEAVMAGVLDGAAARTLPEVAAQFVAAVLAAHRVNPRLHQALHQMMARSRSSVIDRMEDAIERRVAVMLQIREGLAEATAARTAVVLVRSVGGVVRTTIRRDPERFDDPALGRILTAMIVDCVAASRDA